MIQVNSITKSFGDLTAVDGISFNVPKGTVFGLLGPNGAGKSTSLRIVSSSLTADSGYVQFEGNDSLSTKQQKKMIGCAPQALAIYEEMTGRENVSFFGSLYELSGRQLKERTSWALDFVGLSDRANSRTRTYSGGMKRRLNLACAIAHDPPILLLDEPTVGVDPQSRNMIFDRIEQLKAEGKTVIYTTHYMEEAERLCDTIAIIDHGTILAYGTVDNLIDRYGGKSVVHLKLTSPPPANSVIDGHLDGLNLRLETNNPLETITELSQKGYQFSTMRVDRADLETVFLSLTGRKLRD